MKKSRITVLATGLCLLFSLFILTACGGSKTIQGTWNAQDANGSKHTVDFQEKIVLFDGVSYNYSLTEQGTTSKGVAYYGFKLDGREYSLVFPEKGDDKTAVILLLDSADDYLTGDIYYALSKDDSVSYQEYAKKYQN